MTLKHNTPFEFRITMPDGTYKWELMWINTEDHDRYGDPAKDLGPGWHRARRSDGAGFCLYNKGLRFPDPATVKQDPPDVTAAEIRAYFGHDGKTVKVQVPRKDDIIRRNGEVCGKVGDVRMAILKKRNT